MRFLDAIGLAYFWEKIKDWANSLFFSKKGGEISPESGLHYIINGEQLDVSISGNENETIHIFNVDENGMQAISIVKTGGTATQVLMADGSVKEVGGKSGIAGLDTNGNVPLANLGNLDTTVAEVVTALPTSNIKRHIYLVKDSDTANNKYAEYVYTGDISAAYDSTKWEKLGDFRATVDLADYAKKSEAMHSMDVYHTATDIQISLKGVNDFPLGFIAINAVTSQSAGVMIPSDKNKLDLFDTSKVTSSIDVAKLLTVDYKGITMKREASRLTVVLNTLDKSSSSLDFTAASPNIAGLMSGADKTKLNGIASGATADSAITTGEIDALFA